MTSVAKPVALTISLETEPKSAPAALVTRLSTPPSSPTKEDLSKREATAMALHEAHVQAVKSLAQRDVERVAQAKLSRNLRSLREREKIERRAELSDIHIANVKENEMKKREEAKQKREMKREALFANRQAAVETQSRRLAALSQACTDAHDRRAARIESDREKNAAEVKRCLNVGKDLKEKEQAALLEASERLAERQAKASERRETAREKAKPTSPNTAKDVRHRVLNDASVAAGLKRRSLAAAMEKAATNREGHGCTRSALLPGPRLHTQCPSARGLGPRLHAQCPFARGLGPQLHTHCPSAPAPSACAAPWLPVLSAH